MCHCDIWGNPDVIRISFKRLQRAARACVCELRPGVMKFLNWAPSLESSYSLKQASRRSILIQRAAARHCRLRVPCLHGVLFRVARPGNTPTQWQQEWLISQHMAFQSGRTLKTTQVTSSSLPRGAGSAGQAYLPLSPSPTPPTHAPPPLPHTRVRVQRARAYTQRRPMRTHTPRLGRSPPCFFFYPLKLPHTAAAALPLSVCRAVLFPAPCCHLGYGCRCERNAQQPETIETRVTA